MPVDLSKPLGLIASLIRTLAVFNLPQDGLEAFLIESLRASALMFPILNRRNTHP